MRRTITKVTIEKKKGKKESANSKLLALVFDNRKDIKDGAYKRLCDELKKNETEEAIQRTCEIDYMLTKVFIHHDGEDGNQDDSVETSRYTTQLSLRAFLSNVCQQNETDVNDITIRADNDGFISPIGYKWYDVLEETHEHREPPGCVKVIKVVTIIRVQEM